MKAPSHGTLNLKSRMKELSRIDKENEKIKDKLISQKTHYPVQKILKDAYKKEEIKRNILFNSSKVLWNHYIDRYERNNFFVGADLSTLNTSQQRIFVVESPYTNYASESKFL